MLGPVLHHKDRPTSTNMGPKKWQFTLPEKYAKVPNHSSQYASSRTILPSMTTTPLILIIPSLSSYNMYSYNLLVLTSNINNSNS